MSASDNLVKEFCQSIGMQAIGFGENQQRSLAFDDKVVVTFLGDETDFVTAISFIAVAKDDKQIRKLLEQNFLPEAHGGGRFALEPNSDRVILTRQWHAVKVSLPEFSDDLEKFVNSAMQAQAYFENPVAESSVAPATEGAPVATDSLTAAYQSI